MRGSPANWQLAHSGWGNVPWLASGVTAVLLFLAAPAFGQVTRAVLGNGLRVVVVPSHLASVVTVEMNYLAGSLEAPPGFAGLAHAQEHMMFRGSRGLSGAQLTTIIAGMGGEFDAETGPTVTQYYFTIPKSELEPALHIEAIRMRNALDSQILWEEERGAIDQEVARDVSDPGYVLYTRLLADLFAGTPYAVTPLGSRESFAKTTAGMLKAFHRTWYRPNNAVLIIAGDVEPDAAMAQVRRLFGPIPAHPVPRRPEVDLKPIVPTEILLDSDLPYGLAVVAFRLPGYASPDYAAGQVLGDVLESARSSLSALVVEGKALQVQFSGEMFAPAGLGVALAAFPRGADGAKVLEQVKSCLAGYAGGEIPSDLVEAAKRQEVTDFELRKGSIAGVAAEWSRAIALAGRSSPDEEIDAVKRVTRDEVARVARAYLRKDGHVTALLLPRESGHAVALKSGPRAESFARSNVKPVALPAWAAQAMALPARIESRPPGTGPSSFVLGNGLRLIVQPTPSVPAVALYGQVKNDPDLEAPPGQEGVQQVLESLLDYGTTTMNRNTFHQALDEIGATVRAGATFSLQVLPEHFERGVELLAQNILHPALPQKAFTVVARETSASLIGLLASPAYLAQRALDKGLYPDGDPALRQATPASVAKLTLEDVRKYHRLAFRPDLTTIVVTGQITPEAALTTITKQLGSWTAIGPKPKTDPPPVPANLASVQAVPDTSRSQDEVTLAETLGLVRSDPDYYPLQVANHVLSGAFYATWLYRDLREKTGLVYYVGATLDVGKTRSLYTITYGCDPANVAAARTLVERDLQQMRAAAVPPAELQRSKALLMRQLPLAESSLDRIAAGLIERSLEGLPLDEPERAARRYLETTSEQARAAFARWVRPEGFVQVTLGPVPGP